MVEEMARAKSSMLGLAFIHVKCTVHWRKPLTSIVVIFKAQAFYKFS